MPSIRFFSRARTESQRGFALLTAVVLAVLYFMLMELMLIDAQRALTEAERFRSRVIAETMADTAAELAARDIVTLTPMKVTEVDRQGKMVGERNFGLNAGGEMQFELSGNATAKGVPPTKARVFIEGRVIGSEVHIDYAR